MQLDRFIQHHFPLAKASIKVCHELSDLLHKPLDCLLVSVRVGLQNTGTLHQLACAVYDLLLAGRYVCVCVCVHVHVHACICRLHDKTHRGFV